MHGLALLSSFILLLLRYMHKSFAPELSQMRIGHIFPGSNCFWNTSLKVLKGIGLSSSKQSAQLLPKKNLRSLAKESMLRTLSTIVQFILSATHYVVWDIFLVS